MGVCIYSALDWASEKGKNYMPALESMAEQSTLAKLEIPTWYDISLQDTSPVLAFFHPLLKVPKLFLCGEEKGIDAVVDKLAKKDVLFGPDSSDDSLLVRFSDFLDELIASPPECWFNNVRCLEQKYSLHPLNMSATDMVSVSGLFFESYQLNAYLAMRATDEYHRPDKKRKAYIRARLANREPEKKRMLKPIEEVEEVQVVHDIDIDTGLERIKIMQQEYCSPIVKISTQKAPEEIKEDEYGDPTDDYGNSVHFNEDGRSVAESEEIREDEYDYPVPEEDDPKEEN